MPTYSLVTVSALVAGPALNVIARSFLAIVAGDTTPSTRSQPLIGTLPGIPETGPLIAPRSGCGIAFGIGLLPPPLFACAQMFAIVSAGGGRTSFHSASGIQPI